MRNSLETRLGIFVVLAVLAGVFILEMVGGFERFVGGHKYYALFRNVQELKVGDRVKMAGVEVGRVEKIQLTNDQVMVKLKVNGKAEVTTSTTASIKFTGLLGQSFVALDFGATNGAPADDGTFLMTTEQPDLNLIMAKLDNVASGFEKMSSSFPSEKIDNLLGPLTDFMRNAQGPLTESISNLQAISSQISQGKGTIGKLIYDESLFNTALVTVSNFQSSADDIKLTLADARNLVNQIEAGQGTIGKLMKDEKLYNEASAFMTNMKEISDKINRGEGSVGKLVNDQEFYKNAKLTLQKLDKATEGLEDQGPLSILSILVNNLL